MRSTGCCRFLLQMSRGTAEEVMDLDSNRSWELFLFLFFIFFHFILFFYRDCMVEVKECLILEE